MSLRHYTWRSMQQRPGRTILTVLSIVIGVTAAVAVGLGTATTRNAYKAMFSLVTGKAGLEVSAKGSGVFSIGLIDEVKKVPGVKVAAPVLDRAGSMSFGDNRRTRLKVLGIDPQLDPLVRDYVFASGRNVATGYEVALDDGLAKFLGLAVNDKVKILGSGRLGGSKEFTIVGLFRIESGVSLAQLGTALIPLSTAQGHFNPRTIPKDSIDKIQIVTDGEADVVLSRIAKTLPDNVEVHKPAASTQLMQETLMASEQGLEVTTIFSLLMAAFIILNTFLMNVSERRRHISIMRAIGATRSQITWSLLSEAMLLGVIGTIIGIATGFGLAYVGTQVIAQAFEVQLPRLVEVMTPWPFIVGAVFGILMSLIGAALPAWMAGQVSPLEGMNRLVRQPSRNFNTLFLVGGLIQVVGSLAVTAACIYGYLPIDVATWAGLPLLIGLVMLNSLVLRPQVGIIGAVLGLFNRVEARLAQKQILRNHMRSALTIGVLFIAGSTGVGMANSIMDNVRDVHDWSGKAIIGDFFVRAMMPDMAQGNAPDLPAEIGEELKQVPHIDLDGTNLVEAKVLPPGQKTDDAVTAIVVSRDFFSDDPAFDLVEGQREGIGEPLRRGEVVIGSVLAHKLSLHAGDKLPLVTKTGVRQVPICGVANDYLVGGVSVYVWRPFAEEWLDATGVDGYIVRLKDGEKQFRPEVETQLAAIAKKYDVLLISQQDVAQSINRFVGGTEWSLWLLVLMGYVVAAFGMVNTLTMNVLEQTRELGLLRIVAMTKKQVRRTIVNQAMIIGGIGLPPGILVGVGIAYVQNLSMPASFGHHIRFHIYEWMLLGTLLGGLAIVIIAAWFPARRATRINVVEALHYE